jgi:hypothetical protein
VALADSFVQTHMKSNISGISWTPLLAFETTFYRKYATKIRGDHSTVQLRPTKALQVFQSAGQKEKTR